MRMSIFAYSININKNSLHMSYSTHSPDHTGAIKITRTVTPWPPGGIIRSPKCVSSLSITVFFLSRFLIHFKNNTFIAAVHHECKFFGLNRQFFGMLWQMIMYNHLLILQDIIHRLMPSWLKCIVVAFCQETLTKKNSTYIK